MIVARAIVFTVLALLVASPALAQSPLTREDRKIFAWFDSLGYAPSLKNLQLVRVWSGAWQSSGDSPRQPDHFPAFLLADDGNRFTVLTLGLRERSFTRGPATGSVMEVKLEFLEFETLVAQQSRPAATAPVDDSGVRDIPAGWTSQLAYAVLARACAERGLEQTAHDLLAAARSADLGDPRPRNPIADLSESIAEEQYSQALTDLQAGVDRAAVRDRLKRLVKNFPKSSFTDFSRDYVARLDRMVKEERERPRQAQPLSGLTGRALIAELIYQLREEVGSQFTSPGGVYFLSQDSLNVTRSGPAQQLVDIGYSAVPQLIDALADSALTRSYYYRNGPRSIVSVRTVLTQILERLSGLRFEDGEKKWRATQAEARRWWKAVRR